MICLRRRRRPGGLGLSCAYAIETEKVTSTFFDMLRSPRGRPVLIIRSPSHEHQRPCTPAMGDKRLDPPFVFCLSPSPSPPHPLTPHLVPRSLRLAAAPPDYAPPLAGR